MIMTRIVSTPSSNNDPHMFAFNYQPSYETSRFANAQVQATARPTKHGNETVLHFADYRHQRLHSGIKILLSSLLVVVCGLVALAGVGRFANIGPFATGIAQAQYDPAHWNLIVVNKWQRIPDNYPTPELTTLSNGEQVDSRIYPDLQRMFDDMRADGLHPYVTAGYRTKETQQNLMDEKVLLYKNEGFDDKAAQEKASEWVAAPGTSEHEIGLAVDINAKGAITTADSRGEHDWLAAHAWRYGFIQRYPEGKESITGVDHEPWHYRYVGAKAAQSLYESGNVLEEYKD